MQRGDAALLSDGAPSSSALTPRAQHSLVASPPPSSRRRAAHPFGPRLSSLIGRLGRWSAERPRAVLAFCGAAALLCALLLMTGVVRIVVETDSSKLWVPNSSAASQMREFTDGFEDPRVAVAIISSRDGASMTQLPQIVEAVKLDERLRTTRLPGLGDYADVCFRAVEGGECPPSSIFTLWNNTDPASAKAGPKVSSVLPMIRAALNAASGSSLDVALSDYLGCIAQNPTDAVATFRMLRLIYPLEDGPNGTAWAEAFQRETLHASFENIAVDSVVPGSYDEELSGMSWDDLVLALFWLPMLAVGVPMCATARRRAACRARARASKRASVARPSHGAAPSPHAHPLPPRARPARRLLAGTWRTRTACARLKRSCCCCSRWVRSCCRSRSRWW